MAMCSCAGPNAGMSQMTLHDLLGLHDPDLQASRATCYATNVNMP